MRLNVNKANSAGSLPSLKREMANMRAFACAGSSFFIFPECEGSI